MTIIYTKKMYSLGHRLQNSLMQQSYKELSFWKEKTTNPLDIQQGITNFK